MRLLINVPKAYLGVNLKILCRNGSWELMRIVLSEIKKNGSHGNPVEKEVSALFSKSLLDYCSSKKIIILYLHINVRICGREREREREREKE